VRAIVEAHLQDELSGPGMRDSYTPTTAQEGCMALSERVMLAVKDLTHGAFKVIGARGTALPQTCPPPLLP
jgi:hypothetical protein